MRSLDDPLKEKEVLETFLLTDSDQLTWASFGRRCLNLLWAHISDEVHQRCHDVTRGLTMAIIYHVSFLSMSECNMSYGSLPKGTHFTILFESALEIRQHTHHATHSKIEKERLPFKTNQYEICIVAQATID